MGRDKRDGQEQAGGSCSFFLLVHPLLLIGPGLINSRVLYLGSAGLAMVIAALLAGIERAKMRQGCTLLLGLLFSLGLINNLAAWRWTGQLGQRFLTELQRLEPQPPPRAEFVLLDMPDILRGVFFFREGLSEAVKLACDGRAARRRKRVPEAGPSSGCVGGSAMGGFLSGRRRLLPGKAACRRPAAQLPAPHADLWLQWAVYERNG